MGETYAGYEHNTVGGLAIVYSPEMNAGAMVHPMLGANQQRGTLAVGEARGNGQTLIASHQLGLVDSLNGFQMSDDAPFALGHIRSERIPGDLNWPANEPYIQPIHTNLKTPERHFAFASNGHFSRILDVSREYGFDYSKAGLVTNSAFMARLVADFAEREDVTLEQSLTQLLPDFAGSPYSFGLITGEQFIAGMGSGIQPLVLGHGENGEIIVASETVGLDMWQATGQRSFEPGETVIFDEQSGLRSKIFRGVAELCIREFTDYALDQSRVGGTEINTYRERIGEALATEAPVHDADVVLGVPERGTPIAIGYARKSGVGYSHQLIKNRYHGITPRPFDRDGHRQRVTSNYNVADNKSLEGKVVVVVDNRMSTSETMARIVGELLKAGVAKIHLRFATPQNTEACKKGKHAEASMALEIKGVQSVASLSLEGLLGVVGKDVPRDDHVCTDCITGSAQHEVKVSIN